MPRRRLSLRRRLLFIGIIAVGTYAFAETLVSLGHRYGLLRRLDVRLYVDESRGVTFCPVRGYRFTPTPCQYARIIKHETEFVGTYYGNNEGFADRDDFHSRRQPGDGYRFAVFGDSFTSATYIARNWPDRAEALFRKREKRVQLMNFSLGGIGLANWWSMLTNIVDRENYELDGVVFAVFCTDLNRTFLAMDHQGSAPIFGSSLDFDPRHWPGTLDEMLPQMHRDGIFVSQAAFDQIVSGQRRLWKPLKPMIAYGLWKQFQYLTRAQQSYSAKSGFDRQRQALIDDIHEYLEYHQLPVVVIHIPNRDGLIDPASEPEWYFGETHGFACEIDAELIDGREAFVGLTPDEIRALWFTHDGHWNQKGSDHFAQFAVDRLEHSCLMVPAGGSESEERYLQPPLLLQQAAKPAAAPARK